MNSGSDNSTEEPNITFLNAALPSFRQLLHLPKHRLNKGIRHSRDFSFWFIFLLREKKKNIH